MKPHAFAFAALLGAALVAGNGCSHHRGEIADPVITGTLRADVPIFLQGPAAAALASPSGYSARVVFEPGGSLTPIAGQLLAQGSKFFFAPDPGSLATKLQKLAGFSYIWDAEAGKGCVLSEGLQGYAPVAFDLRATNVTLLPGRGPAAKTGGYACEPQQARVQMSDGTQSVLEVLRALDPKGLPVRVTVTANPPLVVNLSKLRAETLRPNLFEPPPGFTKYENAMILADEVVLRQRNIRRGKGPAVPSYDQ